MQGGVFLKNKVEQLRKERGLNQDDFAKMLRVYYKLVDCLEKCLIYGHIRRFAD